MAIGWISIHRKIQDCTLWESEEPFDIRSAWIDLILLANHEDKRIIFDGKVITVKRGQRITSLQKLSERWHWSRDRVRRYLNLLESEKMITRESDHRKTLLTLINYEIYQTPRDTDNTTHKATHNTTDKTTHKATHKATDKSQTIMINNDITMRNNENNENNENKKERGKAPRQTYGEYKHVRLTEEEFNRLCNDFGDKDTLQAIKILDEYCQETGKTYKDYNLTLRRWPMEEARKKPGKKAGGNDLDSIFADWDERYGGNQNDKR